MSLLVDTNLLTRISEPDHAQYPVASDAINTLLANGEVLYVAPQNLYEFWVVATRPVSNNGLGMSIAEAKVRLDDFVKVFRLLSDTSEIFSNWLKLVTDHECRGKTAHDARLGALRHGCGRARWHEGGRGNWGGAHCNNGSSQKRDCAACCI